AWGCCVATASTGFAVPPGCRCSGRQSGFCRYCAVWPVRGGSWKQSGDGKNARHNLKKYTGGDSNTEGCGCVTTTGTKTPLVSAGLPVFHAASLILLVHSANVTVIIRNRE